MNEQALKKSNLSKYGPKEFDQISLAYKESKEKGDIWCSENIKRYLGRFTRPGSSKANNLTDLYKAADYLERMIEMNSKYSNVKKEEIEEKF